MGGGNWSHDAFSDVRSARTNKSTDQVFTTRSAAQVKPDVLAANKPMRECLDSADHPNSTAIILAFDETGSMGKIPEYFARQGIGDVMKDLLEKQPVSDPALCVMAVGDHYSDHVPLQVGEFESDNRIDQWLTSIYLEGNGGGQVHESYGLVHYFAGTRTVIDCMTKRGRKGFLFTVGDENPHPVMSKDALLKACSGEVAGDVTIEEAIAAAQRLYEVFHIIVPSQSYAPDTSLKRWRELLGERALVLQDYKALPELVTATIAVVSGLSADQALAGFSADATALVKATGVTNLARGGGASGVATI